MPSVVFRANTNRLGAITYHSVKRWIPSLAIWGVGTGIIATYVLSVTPVVKNGLLSRIPIVKHYYEDKVPAEDKPF